VFWAAHDNSIRRMLEINSDQGQDWGNCVPTPAVGHDSPAYNISSNPDLLYRLFLSRTVLDLWGTLNCLQSGSPPSAHESVQLTLCHTLRGQDPLLHNRMGMRP